MKHVKVRYYSLYTMITDKYEEEIELHESATLQCLIHELIKIYGSPLEKKIYAADGRWQKTCWFLVNGKRVAGSANSVLLFDGDEVIITLPMLMGG